MRVRELSRITGRGRREGEGDRRGGDCGRGGVGVGDGSGSRGERKVWEEWIGV